MTKRQLIVQDPLVAVERQLIDTARQRMALAVNAELTRLYWQIGRRIGIELLRGQRADYGKQEVAKLVRQLTVAFGKGWRGRQLHYCVRLAEIFHYAEILHTLCAQLSWSHLRLPPQSVMSYGHDSPPSLRAKRGNPSHVACRPKQLSN